MFHHQTYNRLHVSIPSRNHAPSKPLTEWKPNAQVPKSRVQVIQKSNRSHKTSHIATYRRPAPSPLEIRSQNRRSRQTLPTPLISSHFLTPSSRWRTSPFHTPSTQFLRPSFTFSFSMALRFATRAGATCTMLMPGTHSGGSTARSTRASADGLEARRRDSLIDTRERARRRETTEVWVRKMDREMSSDREGREGEASRGGRMARVCRSR